MRASLAIRSEQSQEPLTQHSVNRQSPAPAQRNAQRNTTIDGQCHTAQSSRLGSFS